MPSASTWWNGTSSSTRVSWSRSPPGRAARPPPPLAWPCLAERRVDAQLARAVEREHALDVEVLAAVGDERRHRRGAPSRVARARDPRPRRRAARRAWQSASSTIAATVSESSRIRRQSRAAIVPMLTLSWLCDSVLRENDAAGSVSLSASAVSAEVEIPIALKPWLPPPFGVEVLGQAAARRGRAQELHLAVEQIGDARHRALEPVHRERRRGRRRSCRRAAPRPSRDRRSDCRSRC